MIKVKHALTAVLCLSIALATFPVSAYQDCRDDSPTHHQHADHDHHQTAHKHEHSTPDGTDQTCCLTHAAQAILLNPLPAPSRLAVKSVRLVTAEQVLLSQPLLLQERPPKPSC